MASAATISSPGSVNSSSTQPVPESAARTAHAVAARQEIRMGRAATAGAGVNWLTLSVMAAFHAGALAALFFFTWQRLTVMMALYVVAINVGIGM
jgi:stearoyl-CoA desaturase (delta-9 desaturase)